MFYIWEAAVTDFYGVPVADFAQFVVYISPIYKDSGLLFVFVFFCCCFVFSELADFEPFSKF